MSLPQPALIAVDRLLDGIVTPRLSAVPALRPGRLQRVHATVRHIQVAGISVDRVDVRASGVRIRPGRQLYVRVDRATVRVRVRQAALDQWARSAGVPLRLLLRPGMVSARTGVGGRRVGDVNVSVRLEAGRLRLEPRGARLFGIALPGSASAPALVLPLPALPRGARLVDVQPHEGAIDLAIELLHLEEPLTLATARRALSVLSPTWTTGSTASRAPGGTAPMGAPATATPAAVP